MDKYINLEELMKFPIRLDHYDKEHGNEHFVYGIETVLEYAENLPAADVAQEWISVEDKLPEVVSIHKGYRSTVKKSIRVLCVCVQKSGKTMVKEGYCEWYNDYPEPRWKIPGTIGEVTHWQYLPQPPKGE